MADTIKIEDIEERVVLVGVSEQDGDDADDSLSELAELVKTAGATVVGTLIQRREKIHPGTYVGTGKVAEIAELLESTGATGIVCDDELSPAQQKNLETYLDTKVMDRTLVILDIFASRATTSEGKIQVELAQLKYRLSRLSGLGKSMSRLGGGIGTRGPGEKKLEVDRRLINDRIAQLRRELKEVQRISYSDGLRSKVNCYGANDVREGVAIMWKEGVDVSITGNSTNPTRFQHPVAGTYKKECVEKGKKYFSVASGGGTGRTLHPDNMAAGPASYGMTDTLGRMHSDAQFAGSSSVPAHVEMMGLIGAGNNPMVGMTVAVAVSVEEAAKAGKF